MQKARDVYIICCEGDAEEKLFGFLKGRHNTKHKTFKPEPMGGFDCFRVFEKTYDKILKRRKMGKSRSNDKIHFVFLIDKDLDDSERIGEHIESNGHIVQFCDPNTEAVLLSLVGINLPKNMNSKDFRDHCKEIFREQFGKKAHKMEDGELLGLIKNEKIFIEKFPELASIFMS